MPQPTLFSLQGIGGNVVDQIVSFVIQSNDGGFIVGIGSNSDIGTGNLDSFCYTIRGENTFLKYNSDATNLEWSKCTSNGTYLFPQDDSNFILIGITTSVPTGWAYKISKEDATASILWRKTYGGNASAILEDAIATNDGGYIMVGETYYADTDFTIHYGNSMNADIGIIKVDSNGNKVWSKVIGGTYDDHAFKVIPGPGDGCYIFGRTLSNDYNCTGLHGIPDSVSDAYLVRLDNNGNILWHHDLGGSGDDGNYGWGVADGKGGVILTSGSNSNDGDVHHHIGDYDYWALEVDSSNNILWDNCYGSIYLEFPRSICKATDGSIWITGESFLQGGEVDTSYGNGDAWIIHADSAGNFLNAKVLGSSNGDEGTMIYPLSGGNIITGGIYSENNGSFNSINWYGADDVFLAILQPNTQTIVKQISANSDVRIFPNPAINRLNISVQNGLQIEVTVIINDILGNYMYSNVNSGKLQIDVSKWPKGFYFIKTVNADGIMTVNKILIE